MWMMWMLPGVGERWRAERNARSNLARLVSKEALERAGPQCVGWLKATWLSMSTSAVGWAKDKGCIVLLFVFVCFLLLFFFTYFVPTMRIYIGIISMIISTILYCSICQRRLFTRPSLALWQTPQFPNPENRDSLLATLLDGFYNTFLIQFK